MGLSIEGIGSDVWLIDFDTVTGSSLEVTKKAFDLLEEADQELLRDRVVLVSVHTHTPDYARYSVRFYTTTASIGIYVVGENRNLFYNNPTSGIDLTLREYVNSDAWKNVECNVSLERAYGIFKGILFSVMPALELRDIKYAYVLDKYDTDLGYYYECTFGDSEGRKVGVEFDDDDGIVEINDVF